MKHPFIAILASLFFLACSESTPEPEAPFEIDAFDQTALDKVAEIAAVAEDYFTGYDHMLTNPYYLVINHPSSSEQSGYLINPTVSTEDLHEIMTEGPLVVFREDDLIDDALNHLNGGLFSFDFEVGGVPQLAVNYIQVPGFYFDYKDQDYNMIPGILVHEMTHIYQFERWTMRDRFVSDQDYPLTAANIPLHLLLQDLMMDAYDVEDVEYDDYLRYYVAIWQQILATDTTTEEVIANVGLYHEFLEGPARYIEHFSLKDTFFPAINDDPSHGWRDAIANATDAATLRQGLIRRGPYHQGAIVCHMLRAQGVDLENQLIAGRVPYEITMDYLQPSTEALDQAFASAQSLVNWQEYLDEGDRLSLLLD